MTNVNFKGVEEVTSPLSEATYADAGCKDSVPEVLKIDVTHNEVHRADLIDVSHVKNSDQRLAIENFVNNYRPNKMREPDITMKLVLKDEEPMYQSARRLSASEKEIVNAQIDQWITDGIVQPSTSSYASPVVLVRKKDDSYRLCVDYRMMNK